MARRQVPGQVAGNLNLFVSGKDDPEFLYSLAGKIGANVSKNINLRTYAPSEIFPLLVKNLFTGNIFIDNYPRIDKSYIL